MNNIVITVVNHLKKCLDRAKAKRFIVLFCVCLYFPVAGFSQVSQITVTGKLVDVDKVAIEAATVMLLNKNDSALINYTTSNAEGYFSFKNIKNNDYILKVSHVTFMPLQKHISKSNEKDVNLGTIEMNFIANFLMEVVIKEAKAPIFIKGDTVEYDATTFKVPPGSTVEDLLRRLPGIDVDGSGNISTMGKDVKTVYVDGKTFFGNDPKTVTQNLDAVAVSKVQVYNEKSTQESLTGISDGTKEKVMNLTLKDEYKKGYFGKASVAGGTQDRWAARGNFNWFNDKQQLSFIGYGNNINQSSLNWSDYSEFKGQSMNNYGGSDFGFGSAGDSYNYFSGSWGGEDDGFSKNYGGGVNYNYFTKKTTFNAGYFIKKSNYHVDKYTFRQTFLTGGTYNSNDTLTNDNEIINHELSSMYKYEIDSFNVVSFKASFSFTANELIKNQNKLYQTDDFSPINLNTIKNITNVDNLGFNTTGLYQHKFAKKGRTFAVNGIYNYKKDGNNDDVININKFFNSIIPVEQTKATMINEKALVNDKQTENQMIKSNALYVEPLSKRLSLMGFYNFRTSNRDIDGKSSTNDSPIRRDIDSLSLKYQSDVLYNRIGSTLNYNHEGVNISVGGAVQSLSLTGFKETISGQEKYSSKAYNNFVPYFECDVEFPNNIYASVSYLYEMEEPSITYLFPVPDLTNQLSRTIGNPNLTPEKYHELHGHVSYWNQAAMANANVWIGGNIYDSRIVYNQTTEFIDSLGYFTTYFPENVDGGYSFWTGAWASFPIIKTVLTINTNPSINFNKSPTIIDGVNNFSNSKSYRGNIGFNLTINTALNFYANTSISSTNIEYSINKDRNQSYSGFSTGGGFKWQVLKKSYFEGSFNSNNYVNRKFDFNQNVQLLNLSIRQILGEKNRWEIRLAATDILKKKKDIKQSSGTNYIQYTTSPTLSRYFMLSVSYNLKGFEVNAKKSKSKNNDVIMVN